MQQTKDEIRLDNCDDFADILSLSIQAGITVEELRADFEAVLSVIGEDWRDATFEELRRYRTLAGLKRKFADARLITADGVNYRYQVSLHETWEADNAC